MPELSLNELLDSVGINKSVLAKLMQVSRSTVMRMGDDVSPEALAVIDQYKADMTHEQSEAVPVPVNDSQSAAVASGSVNVSHGILPVTHRNIALSRTWHDLDNIEVARRFNLSRFDYNQHVKETIRHCAKQSTSFNELRA